MGADKAEIGASFAFWLAENTPPGTRLVIHQDGFLDLDICCNGRVPDTAYVCAYKPGHKGDCWSRHKNVNFTPEIGGPIDYLVTLGPREGM